MSALFDSWYRGSAAPAILAYNGDTPNPIVVTVDGEMVLPALQCVIQNRAVFSEVGVDGVERRIETCAIVFPKADIGELKGLTNPQIKYEFHIGSDIWTVDHRDGSAITSISESMASVSLRRSRAMRKTLREGTT